MSTLLDYKSLKQQLSFQICLDAFQRANTLYNDKQTTAQPQQFPSSIEMRDLPQAHIKTSSQQQQQPLTASASGTPASKMSLHPHPTTSSSSAFTNSSAQNSSQTASSTSASAYSSLHSAPIALNQPIEHPFQSASASIAADSAKDSFASTGKHKAPLLARSAVRIIERENSNPDMHVDPDDHASSATASSAQKTSSDPITLPTDLFKNISISPLQPPTLNMHRLSDRGTMPSNLVPMDVDISASNSIQKIQTSKKFGAPNNTDTLTSNASDAHSSHSSRAASAGPVPSIRSIPNDRFITGKQLNRTVSSVASNGTEGLSESSYPSTTSNNTMSRTDSDGALSVDSTGSVHRVITSVGNAASQITKLIETGKLKLISPDDLVAHLRASQSRTTTITQPMDQPTELWQHVPGASSDWNQPSLMLLIDVRIVSDFQRAYVTGSICANFPALLVKRFRRRIVSNFNLSNFLTSDTSVKLYTDWKQSVIADCVNAFNPVIVVYDDQMSLSAPDSDAWAFVTVLAECIGNDIIKYGPESVDRRRQVTISFLVDGFRALSERSDAHEFIRRVGVGYSGLNSGNNGSLSQHDQNAVQGLSGQSSQLNVQELDNISSAGSSDVEMGNNGLHTKRLSIKPVVEGGSAGGTITSGSRCINKSKLSLKHKVSTNALDAESVPQSPSVLSGPSLIPSGALNNLKIPSSMSSGVSSSSLPSTASVTSSTTTKNSTPSSSVGPLSITPLKINKKGKFALAIDTQSPVRTTSKTKLPLVASVPGQTNSLSLNVHKSATSKSSGGTSSRDLDEDMIQSPVTAIRTNMGDFPIRNDAQDGSHARNGSDKRIGSGSVSRNNSGIDLSAGRQRTRGASSLRNDIASDTTDPNGINNMNASTTSVDGANPESASPDTGSRNSTSESAPPTTSPNDNAAPPEPFSRITPNMIVGSDALPLAPDAVDQLSSLGVTHILNMAAEVTNSPSVLASSKFCHKWLPVHDNTEQDMDGPLREAIDFITSAFTSNPNAVVFVHCKAGRSRSVSVVIGYLVATRKHTLKSAYELVRKIRKGVSPNLGFMAALLKVEKDVHGENVNQMD